MRVAVVGAGVAGLTVAERLSAAGCHLLVLDSACRVGGLARSWRYGPFTFDVGPHRFHSDRGEITRFIRDVLGDRVRTIGRRSAVFFRGHTYAWPLRPGGLVKLPPWIAWRALVDLLRRPPFDGVSFESYVVSRYGQTLFEQFFRPYTEKFAYEDCSRLHHSWARAGVRRALIDKSIRMEGLADVIRMVVLPGARPLQFLYPRGGCGVFAERLARRVEAGGGRIELDAADVRPVVRGGRVRAVALDGHEEPVDHLVWTAPLPQLLAALGMAPVALRYMDTVFYNLELRRPLCSPHQWIYYGASEICFVRVSRPRHFDPENVPPGRDALCVEVTARRSDLLENPERAIPRVLVDLEKVHLARTADIDRVHVEPVRQTYPIYGIDYPGQRAAALRATRRVSGLIATGRTGAFFYNNMDDSIAMGLGVARRILGGRRERGDA